MARDNRPIPAPHPDDYLFPRPRALREREAARKVAPTSLPRAVRTLLHAVVYGVDQELFTNSSTPVKPGTPLSYKQASFAVGFYAPKMDFWIRTRVWRATLRELVNERRYAEEPENLAAAIAIRDDVGANTPDDRRVRLQAIGVIRPKELATAVNINLQQNNATVNQISPGYVIKLDNKD